MKTIAIIIVALLTVGSIAVPIGILTTHDDIQVSNVLFEIPLYEDGYGYDNETGIMQDTNGFQYSYQADGIVKLVLPWGYTTHFSFGLTGNYLGVPQIKTALDYSWNWDIIVGECLNETGNLTGYSYTFTATNDAGSLDWTIAFEFNPNARMKVTHTIENGYANTLENVEFWYLFDLLGTVTPYTIETELGTVEGPLYQEIPDSVYWVRLANQFQFNWRDALVDYENANAYIGDGSVIGMSGVPILGISLDIGSIAPGDTVAIDPYFSGVERTWTAAADGVASNPARWTPVGVPQTGDNITFDGTSVFNCNWNVVVTLGDFSMLTGYTGTITQAASFSVTSYSQATGVYTGSISYTLTDSGDFTKTGGSVTANTLTLEMSGTDKTVNITTVLYMNSLTISGNTFVVGVTVSPWNLIIALGKTLTVNVGGALMFRHYAGTTTFSNDGIIAGAKLNIALYDADKTIDFGAITAPIEIIAVTSATTNRILALTTDASLSSTLSFSSAHATYTITVDLSSNNYNLSTTDITIGTRGILNGRTSIIECSGDWDSSAGTFTQGTSTVLLTGASKTLAMNAADSFFNVTIAEGASYTMDTDTTVRLRATITGELLGTGDFLEPLPEFTSRPIINAYRGEIYEYVITQTYWDDLEIIDGPYWLYSTDHTLEGVPYANQTGIFYVSIALTWNDMITYQNFTLYVSEETPWMPFDFFMYFSAMLILLAINIIGACVPQVRILTLFGIFGIAILCVPTALVMWEYGPIALILILVNVMVPVMSTVNNIKDK